MDRKRTFVVFVVGLVVWGASSDTTRAEVLVYEPFDGYQEMLPGSEVRGTGFAAGAKWPNTIGTRCRFRQVGLAYRDLKVAGGCLKALGITEVNLDVGQDGVFARQGLLTKDGKIGADGKTLYVSWLARNFAMADPMAGLELIDANSKLLVGYPGAGGFAAADYRPRATTRVTGSHTAMDANTHLFVIRISFLPGDDDMRIFIDPDVNAGEHAQQPILKGNLDLSFNKLRFGCMKDPGWEYDELRIATTWRDAIPLQEPVAWPSTELRDKVRAIAAKRADDPAVQKKALQGSLTRLDDPLEAMQYLGAGGDKDTRFFLPILTGDTEVMSPGIWSELGTWYGELGAGLKANDQRNTLIRAARYLSRGVLHSQDPTVREAAKAKLNEFQSQLAKLGATHDGSLTSTPVAKLAAKGRWQNIDHQIMSQGNWAGRLVLREVPQGDYDLHSVVSLVTAGGSDEITWLLPVGDGAVRFSIGGNLPGLHVDGAAHAGLAFDSERLKSLRHLRPGREHTVSFQVRLLDAGQAEVMARVNEALVCFWKGNSKDLSVATAWTPNKPGLAIGAHLCQVVFSSIDLVTYDAK